LSETFLILRINERGVIKNIYRVSQNDVNTNGFQQDGAPPHFALTVRAYLDHTFPGRWIGRSGPLPWPPHSLDLTPCDFWL